MYIPTLAIIRSFTHPISKTNSKFKRFPTFLIGLLSISEIVLERNLMLNFALRFHLDCISVMYLWREVVHPLNSPNACNRLALTQICFEIGQDP